MRVFRCSKKENIRRFVKFKTQWLGYPIDAINAMVCVHVRQSVLLYIYLESPRKSPAFQNSVSFMKQSFSNQLLRNAQIKNLSPKP